MKSQLLLLLLLRVVMGLSAPPEKSKDQPSLRLCKETQINRPLGEAEPLQGSVAIENDLPGCNGTIVLGLCLDSGSD